MKKLLTLCFVFAIAFTISAQTGANGLVAQINSPYTITPTSVDSTTIVNVQFNNTLPIANIVSFTGLNTPFSVSPNPISIPANDSVMVDISFTPNSVGNFSDTLDFTGSVFGGGQIILNAEGVLVVIATSTDSLNLGSISLGTSITDSIMVYNTGTGGTMAITNLSSNNTDFTASSTTTTIAEGDSMYVYITFSPVLTGVSTATIGIESNDPNTPTYNIYVEGTAVSHISGALCGTLSLINSPYTLIGDVTVADSCTLIIEPGVIVNCAQYSVLIDGTLQAIGTATDSIIINDFSTIAMHNSTSNDSINFVKFDSDDSYISLSNQDNSLNNCFVNTGAIVNGFVEEVFDFEDGQWPTYWSNTGSFSVGSSYGNPGYGIYASSGINDYELLTDFYAVGKNQVFSCDYKRHTLDNNNYVRLYYRINNGGWNQFWYASGSYGSGSGNWENITYTIPSDAGDMVQIKFLSDGYPYNNYQYDECKYYLDNIQFGETFIPIIKSETAFNDCNINGDITTANDVVINNSTLTATNVNAINSYRGNIIINNSTISGGDEQVIYTEDDSTTVVSLYNTTIKDSDGYGIYSTGDNSDVTLYNTTIRDNGNHGIYSIGDNTEITLYNTTIRDNDNHGIYTTGSSVDVNIQYSFIKDNGQDGIYQTGGSSTEPVILTIDNSSINNNGDQGISQSTNYGTLFLNYSNITDNVSYGIYVDGIGIVTNSILWNNEFMGSHRQISSSNGVTNIEYSSVMGLYTYGLYPIYGTSGQFYVANALEEDPMYLDTLFHIHPTSGVVDGGDISDLDSIMPEGLGSPIADMGMYGGPANWFWGGGTPVSPSFGAPVLTIVQDISQDQGGQVGILWDASLWDDYNINNRVEEYSIWRHLDFNGGIVDSIQNGNWELMGYTPAQAFNAYAYVSSTLGDSNLVTGGFNSCFLIKAHTSIAQLSYISNVLCGYSTDDLAPSSPVVSAMAAPNTPDDVIVYWDAPAVADYAYSEVYSSIGTSSLGTTTDTLMYDYATQAGGTYTYAVRHFDTNGNPSDTAWVTITLDDNEDVIPLTAGWNLISTKQVPTNNSMQDVFSTLMPGNLVYVTGFNQGSSLYNPNGLPFLNTLNQFTDGYGYWVKVLADDTLTVTGSTIAESYKIPLMPGWNLSGYMNPQASSTTDYLGSLISSNNLEYCTGFNQGTQVFNPNGLPFLNTLTSMQRPYGYWIKVSTAVNSGNYRLANNEGLNYSPEFMFVNGTSNLESHVGEFVEVFNSVNELIATLEIIEGGYLMTTALYGDDPQSEQVDGLQDGEYLTFKFNGDEINSDIAFKGNMELRVLDLNFDNGGAWSIYPNPLTTTTTINYEITNTSNVSIKVFDITGRQIDEVVNARQDASYYSATWDATYFEKGVYMIELHINGTKVTTERVVVQ